jgi:hypothetical protein
MMLSQRAEGRWTNPKARANDDALKLAKGLRAAIDKTASAKS